MSGSIEISMYVLLVSLLLFVPSFVYGMSEQHAVNTVFNIARLYESEITAEHINELEKALLHVGNIKERYRCIRDFQYKDTFLLAAALRNITCCRILVAHNADVDKEDQWGNTAFDMARRFCCSGTMLFLLEMGADNFKGRRKDMTFWSEETKEHFYQILEVHRKKVAGEVASVLTRDTAGIVSEYAVGKKRRAITQ